MTTVEDSQAKMAFKAYEQGGELALLAFIAGRTVSEATAQEWIQNGRMQFDDQSSVTQQNQEYRLEYQADGSTTSVQPEQFNTVLPNHMKGPRPHPRTREPQNEIYPFVVNPTQLNPAPAWAELLVHQLKDAKTFQVTVEAEMTEENARQLTGKNDATPFMAIIAYDDEGIYTLNWIQELSDQVSKVTKTMWVPKATENLTTAAKHGLISMLEEALGKGANIAYTVDDDFVPRWATQLVAVLQPADQIG